MKFTSPRKIVLAAFGHVVAFEKGDTKFLPKPLHAKALEEGLEPEDADAEVVTAVSTVDDADRIAKIKEAMTVILENNDSKDFTAGGAPKVKVVEDLAGVKLKNAEEGLKLWAEVRDGAGQ